MYIPDIDFGEKIYCENEGGGAVVYSYANVTVDDFDLYISKLTEVGFDVYNKFVIGYENKAVNLKNSTTHVYAMYYPNIGEMRIVWEAESEYFNLKDTPRAQKTTPLLTQIELEDYGQSSVIRLDDGRFVIFDGGWDFEPDAERLMQCLREQSPYERPIVAAWIMTHPDVDHYRCCIVFFQKYADCVEVERFIYNFPDANEDNVKRVPALAKSDHLNKINELNSCVEKWNAQLIRAHTGQIYNFSDAKLEVLSSPDDCFIVPVACFNDVSLIIKMTISGQTILWCGDANFEIAKLGERWSDYLKSDILQIPHHAFAGGRKEEYSLIDPKVCLLTGDEDIYFGRISIYRPENKFLITDLNVEEWLMNGNGTYTIKLPYTPKANGRKLLLDKLDFHHKMAGAYSWFFDGVTSYECNFVFVNTTAATATIYADLYFENAADFVSHIKINVEGCTRKCVNLLDTNVVDSDALFYNNNSVKEKGVPEGKAFTVHFKSDVPVVIKGSGTAVYYF